MLQVNNTPSLLDAMDSPATLRRDAYAKGYCLHYESRHQKEAALTPTYVPGWMEKETVRVQMTQNVPEDLKNIRIGISNLPSILNPNRLQEQRNAYHNGGGNRCPENFVRDFKRKFGLKESDENLMKLIEGELEFEALFETPDVTPEDEVF